MNQSLPIFACSAAIVQAVRRHRVVVVEGPAGCGKTTQLPQILLEAGLCPRGTLGVTQPRRIAAVSVAWRIAQEQQTQLGQKVGYAIRFDDVTSPHTRIKVMTDGILLQEARHDAAFSQYDLLMVDEAHERSLNIDFMLGLLVAALHKRDDLRVVLSSATINPEQFVRFFAPATGKVPIVSLDARSYPLNIMHCPLTKNDSEQLIGAVCAQVEQIQQSGRPGHILVFLPGEALINKILEALQLRRMGDAWCLLPLYGRLTRGEQERIFAPQKTARKIILSTNLAETSITIDGVGFVIDSGLHKLPYFSANTGVTTLREEPISLASATQRAGRAGRTGPGEVLRLYSEQSLASRPPYTPEEILRVDLSEAVLRLIDLGITDIENFALPTPPPRAKIAAAIRTLTALGAIDKNRALTQIGRQMVPFPLSPQLSRMVVEAAAHAPAAVSDVLLVGAYLSVRSPFTYPAGQEEEARRAKGRFADPLGDAITALRALHSYNRTPDKALYCQKNFLDPDTMAFIVKAHAQLCDIAEDHGVAASAPCSSTEAVVRCVATGFADRILCRQGFMFETAQGLKAALHPSSSLFGRAPRFIVAAELMKAGRLYAFNASALRPEWIEALNAEAAHAFGLSRHKKTPQTPPPKVAWPTHLDIGGQKLPVVPRRRRPLVELSVEQAQALSLGPPVAAMAEHGQWRAQISHPDGVLLRSSLPQVLRAIFVTAWHHAGTPAAPQPPLGALLEPDRNLYTLQRHLRCCGEPAFGSRQAAPKQRPGWLALVANGAGGFWFDVLAPYDEALQVSLTALEALLDAGAETSALHAEARTLHRSLGAQAARYLRAVHASE